MSFFPLFSLFFFTVVVVVVVMRCEGEGKRMAIEVMTGDCDCDGCGYEGGYGFANRHRPKNETFEERERKQFALSVLDSPEQLMMYAQSTNDVSFCRTLLDLCLCRFLSAISSPQLCPCPPLSTSPFPGHFHIRLLEGCPVCVCLLLMDGVYAGVFTGHAQHAQRRRRETRDALGKIPGGEAYVQRCTAYRRKHMLTSQSIPGQRYRFMSALCGFEEKEDGRRRRR